MMTQSPLSFQYEKASHDNFTSFAGLPLFQDLANVCGLTSSLTQNLKFKSQGWTDSQIVQSLLLLNLAGGDCIEDIDRLESDRGLNQLLREEECKGMRRKERRAYQRRFRKSKQRAFPSSSALHRYLLNFHNSEEEQLRVAGTAFVPESNGALKALTAVNQSLINAIQHHRPSIVATLDQDATLTETNKSSALYCYKKFKAYQPFNTYWDEQGILLHSEFRDGNVPAGFDQLRLLKKSLELLPKGVEKVRLRSDSAGYQEDLIRYCTEKQNERFGEIEFAISIKVSEGFKAAALQVREAEWNPIYKDDESGMPFKTGQEWAEVSFVPSWVTSKKTPDYRFIALRECLSPQQSLPGMEEETLELPFPTLAMKRVKYKLFGIITNSTMGGNELINWHRGRCGNSEKVHSVEKTDLAGGQFPSNKFGVNAAWWQIMVLAFNLKTLMQKLVLPKPLARKRMKGLRFHLIQIAGCVVTHARKLIVKVGNDSKIIGLLQFIKKKIAELAHPPPGGIH